ncbi:MAG: aldehyde dehydrogenase [Pseudomonadota bacterium]
MSTFKQCAAIVAALAASAFGVGTAYSQTIVTDEAGNSEEIFEIGTFYPAPGAQVTYDYCTGCHSEMIIVQQGQTRENWDELLVWMAEEMGMGEIDEEDRSRILNYLATHYNPDRPHFPRN